MPFYNPPHRFYCGVDPHARSRYLCILDQTGTILFHEDLPADRDTFLEAVAPYRDDLVVCCECLFCWYWLADLCQEQQFAFVLGHALYLKAIHGGKAKDDNIDAAKVARLRRGPGQAFPTVPGGQARHGQGPGHPRSREARRRRFSKKPRPRRLDCTRGTVTRPEGNLHRHHRKERFARSR